MSQNALFRGLPPRTKNWARTPFSRAQSFIVEFFRNGCIRRVAKMNHLWLESETFVWYAAYCRLETSIFCCAFLRTSRGYLSRGHLFNLSHRTLLSPLCGFCILSPIVLPTTTFNIRNGKSSSPVGRNITDSYLCCEYNWPKCLSIWNQGYRSKWR